MNRRIFIRSGSLGLTGIGLSAPILSAVAENAPLPTNDLSFENDDSVLNYHLMHPGGGVCTG